MRRNIGFVIDNVDGVFTKDALKGADIGANAIDANLFVFPGRYLHSVYSYNEYMPYEYQFNCLFQFAAEKKLDILFIMLGVIGACVEEEKRRELLEQYIGIPVVTLYMETPGYNSMMFNNTNAFMEGIRHIILDKGAKKVGYVSGPETNTDAQERLSAYKQVMNECNLPIQDDWIMYGDFADTCAPDIHVFLQAHMDLDAVIFANDLMAKAGYSCMEQLHIRPGRDMLVMGFDNSCFATSLEPGLTTVEANATELSFKAIKNTEHYLQSDSIQTLRVNTHLIHRASCGCFDADYKTLSEKLYISQIFDQSMHETIMKKIFKYLFGEFIDDAVIQDLKKELADFITGSCELLTNENTEQTEKQIRDITTHFLHHPVFRYTTTELYMNVLSAVLYSLKLHTNNDAIRQSKIMELYASIYHEIALNNYKMSQKQQLELEQLSNVINGLSIDISQGNDIHTLDNSFLLSQLSSVGIGSSFLYTFSQPIRNERFSKFKKPKRLLFKAYSVDENTYAVPVSRQSVPVSDLFFNKKMHKDRRGTYIVNPLFAQDMLYGLLVCEATLDSFCNVATISNQISMVMKTISLLTQQMETQMQLQRNLELMAKTNMELNQKSKTDQLTGLYNRWGFMERVQAAITNPDNTGKKLVIIFADMDNLKVVNDTYGHDEGDYAIREISCILKETLEEDDVVARFGGDEFVAFTLTETSGHEDKIKKRIVEISNIHNEAHHKPFRVEMSTGIFEATCHPDLVFQQLLFEADKKLYAEKRAKKAGRDF